MSERILKMPRLGETMEEGKIVGWLIKPGDSFKRGDAIIEIETDKTIAEFPALGDGKLNEILVSDGDTVQVGMPLARIDIGDGPDWTAEEDDVAEAPPPAAHSAGEGGTVETDLPMPRLGETMEEGRVAKWLKQPGERFGRGEAILEIETDKTVAEFPALAPGRLVRILRNEGDMVAVGDPIARIEVMRADVSEDAPVATAAAEPATAKTIAAAIAPTRARADGRVRATPLARRIARQKGIDIASITGTGRRGRIEKDDVLAAAGGTTAIGVAVQTPGVSYAALRRGRMAYLDSGKVAGGDTVLLLHGFAGDRTTWAAVFSGLKRAGKRVLAPDLPGHGLTEIDAATPVDLSADLVEFLDAVGADRVEIVAHSLGAVAAVNLASGHPGRVRALTLIAPAGLGSEIDDGFVHGMAAASTGGEVAHLLRRISVNGIELTETALSVLAADMAKGRLRSLADAVSGPSGQKVDSLMAIQKLAPLMPVRVLFGLEDRIVPWKHVLSLPPRVAVHILARSGHMPQWDQTRDVLDILLAGGS